MNTKGLMSWCLIVGPVGTFVVFGMLSSILVGPAETPASGVAELLANKGLARIIGVVGCIFFVAMPTGLMLLARSMQGDDKPGSVYATVSATIFSALLAVGIIATSFPLGVLDVASRSARDAEGIFEVGNALFSGIGVFWPLAMILLGVAITMQKNLHIYLGWLFVVGGAWLFIDAFTNLGSTNDIVGFANWIGMSLIVVASGVLSLRSDQAG